MKQTYKLTTSNGYGRRGDVLTLTEAQAATMTDFLQPISQKALKAEQEQAAVEAIPVTDPADLPASEPEPAPRKRK